MSPLLGGHMVKHSMRGKYSLTQSHTTQSSRVSKSSSPRSVLLVWVRYSKLSRAESLELTRTDQVLTGDGSSQVYRKGPSTSLGPR